MDEKKRDRTWAKAWRAKVTVVLYWGDERWEARGTMRSDVRTAFPYREEELTVLRLVDWDFRLVPGGNHVR